MCTVQDKRGPALVYEAPYLGHKGVMFSMSTHAGLHTCSGNVGVVKILYCMVDLIFLKFMWWLFAINNETNNQLSFYRTLSKR